MFAVRALTASVVASTCAALLSVASIPPAFAQAEADASKRPECAWTGQRIVGMLWRDDLNGAREHFAIYERFECPADHVRLAFRCVVKGGEIDADDVDTTRARIWGCWMTPDG